MVSATLCISSQSLKISGETPFSSQPHILVEVCFADGSCLVEDQCVDVGEDVVVVAEEVEVVVVSLTVRDLGHHHHHGDDLDPGRRRHSIGTIEDRMNRNWSFCILKLCLLLLLLL